MTLTDISPIVSVVALVISLFTVWFTIFWRGTVRSTHPHFIAFRYDFVRKKVPQAKIFLRLLLFSTGKRGRVIESLFLRVHEGSRNAEFSFWGYGDKDLVRGSGLFVPETGVVTNHHFNPIDAGSLFHFSVGRYELALVAKLVGTQRLISLWTGAVDVPEGLVGSPIPSDTAVYFNWSPGQKRYVASVERIPTGDGGTDHVE